MLNRKRGRHAIEEKGDATNGELFQSHPTLPHPPDSAHAAKKSVKAFEEIMKVK